MDGFPSYIITDSVEVIYYSRHGNSDDVDGSNNTVYSGEPKPVCFFLKGKLERWRGEIELKN